MAFPEIQYARVLTLSVESAAGFYVVDPKGRTIGIDPATGRGINNIPGATYNGADAEPQVVMIPSPLVGSYEVELLGTGTGPFALNTELALPSATITHSYTDNITNGEIITLVANVSGTDLTLSAPAHAPSSALADKPAITNQIKLQLLWLTATARNMNLEKDVKQGLLDKLADSTAKIGEALYYIKQKNGTLSNNMLNSTKNSMYAFIDLLRAQEGESISVADAQSLAVVAEGIVQNIEAATAKKL